MAGWKNWAPPVEIQRHLDAAKAAAGPAYIDHVSQCDDATKFRLRQWIEAKRSKDFATADPIRNELRAKWIEPDKICAQESISMWSPLIMNAQQPLFIPPAPSFSMNPMGGSSFNFIDPLTGMPAPRPGQMKRPLAPSRSYEELDDITKAEVSQWLDCKRNKEYVTADIVRMTLRSKNVDPDTIMIETNWLKKFKANSWTPSAVEENAGPIPKVIRLSLAPTSGLYLQGYVDPIPAIEYKKEQPALSEATWIIQEFFGNDDFHNSCTIQHDPESTLFPEVFNAWKAAGHEDCMVTVATCPSLQKAAIGLGGRKNGERAAKLALAVALAGCHPLSEKAQQAYPNFAKVLRAEEELQSGIRQ